jgi:hypothetical protein
LQSSFDSHAAGQTQYDQVNEGPDHGSNMAATLGRFLFQHKNRDAGPHRDKDQEDYDGNQERQVDPTGLQQPPHHQRQQHGRTHGLHNLKSQIIDAHVDHSQGGRDAVPESTPHEPGLGRPRRYGRTNEVRPPASMVGPGRSQRKRVHA